MLHVCVRFIVVDRLKRTSPTAYCDCWEKCKCKSLVAGNTSARFDLLNHLLTETNLVQLPNSKSVTTQTSYVLPPLLPTTSALNNLY